MNWGATSRWSQVACRNFKMSRVGVLSRFHVAVAHWARYNCPCRNLIKWQTTARYSCGVAHFLVTMAAFSSFWDFWPSFHFLTSFLTFLFTRSFHLGPWFTLVFFVILVLLLMLSSHDQRISQIKRWQRLTQQITYRHKLNSPMSSIRDWQSRSRTSQGHCLFVYGTRYTNCAANRRHLAYFLLLISFYEFWSSKKIAIHETGPNYFNSLSLIIGFDVAVGIS